MSRCVYFIEGLFERLALRYGSPFTDRWAGLSLAVEKEDWAQAGQLRPTARRHQARAGTAEPG